MPPSPSPKPPATLAELVQRAHVHQEATTLTEDGTPVARIVPVEKRLKTAKELAAWLAGDRPRLGPEEAAAFEQDIIAFREAPPSPFPEWD